jgi:acyl carrier protein
MTETTAIEWIADLFQVAPERLTANTAREDIEAWDSMGVLKLLAALDSDFGVEVSDDEIQGMKRLGDILAILRRTGRLNEDGADASKSSRAGCVAA